MSSEEPSDFDVRNRLTKILETSDLTTLTRKAVRKQLDQEYGYSFSGAKWKAFIKTEIKAYVANKHLQSQSQSQTPTAVAQPVQPAQPAQPAQPGAHAHANSSGNNDDPPNNNDDSNGRNNDRSNDQSERYDRNERNERNERNDGTRDLQRPVTKKRRMNDYGKSEMEDRFGRPHSDQNSNRSHDNDNDNDNGNGGYNNRRRNAAKKPPQRQKRYNNDSNPESEDDEGFGYNRRNSNSIGKSNRKKKEPEYRPKLASNRTLLKKSSAGGFFMRLPGSGTKRITINKFKKKMYIGIREYYTKDGEERPGKKGCNMTMEQWQFLAKHMAEITKCAEDF